MNKIIYLVCMLSLTFQFGIAQTNQNADPGIVAVFQTPNSIPNVGDMAQMCIRITNAGTDPIPANTVIVTMSWGTLVTFDSDNNVAIQGWTIFQSSPNSVSMRNTTDVIDAANLDVKDLCVNVTSVAMGTSTVSANITRAIGVSSMVGNTSVVNDNAQSGSEVLPVELVTFKAASKDDAIGLEWITASEINNAHFYLERSENGKNFKPIAKVKGNGTTVEQSFYDYLDTEVIPNTDYYYRLKQVDFDGAFAYSHMVSGKILDDSKDYQLNVYPNPVGSTASMLTIELFCTQPTIQLAVKDFKNQTVKIFKFETSSKGYYEFQLNVGDLPAGNYIIQADDGRVANFIKMEE